METLLMLKGLGAVKQHWLGLDDCLQDCFPALNVVSADNPGYGELQEVDVPTSLSQNIDLILDQYNITAPFHFVGSSLAGMSILDWYEKNPDKVKSICLINSSIESSNFFRRLTPRAASFLIRSAFTKDPLRKEVLGIQSTTSILNEEQINQLANENLHLRSSIPSRSVAWQLLSAIRFKSPKTVEVPMYILAGLRDTFVHHSCSLEIAKKYNCKVDIHETGGHDLAADDFPWLAEKVIRWVATHSKIKPKADFNKMRSKGAELSN